MPDVKVPTQDQALKMIEQLGGSVVRDEDGTVSRINLGSSKITDAELVLVRAFPQVRGIDLSRTRIGNTGLTHLRDLTALEELQLYNTDVNDSGMENLRRLSRLRWLMLKRTYVRGPGVEILQLALPGCRISWSDRSQDRQPSSTVTPPGEDKEVTEPDL